MMVRTEGNKISDIIVGAVFIQVVSLYKNIPLGNTAHSIQLDKAGRAISSSITFPASRAMEFTSAIHRTATSMAKTLFGPLFPPFPHKVTSFFFTSHILLYHTG